LEIQLVVERKGGRGKSRERGDVMRDYIGSRTSKGVTGKESPGKFGVGMREGRGPHIRCHPWSKKMGTSKDCRARKAGGVSWKEEKKAKEGLSDFFL